ncbi:MAG: hypothetical protein BWK78_03425 [Thiotrichaceae bacterium IS1]|nr:MAG: hypothetical protein BWK78_03425 [Thiotrichaceae bacterium IS1]
MNDKSALAYAKLYLTELQKNLCLSGENEKADCEKKAQTTAEGLNNKNALDYAKLYLDDLCSSWKDQKADCDKKAQTIAKGLNDKNALAYYAKLYFAKLCLSRGNPKEDCYKEAQTIEKGLNDKSASAYAKLYLADLCLSGENKGADCYFESVNLLEDAIAKDAQSYPKLKQGGQITNADSFVSSSFGFYWPPSSKVTPEQEKCKEVCKVYSSPCVQDKLPKECKEVCRDVTPLFLRDYHPELSFRLAWQLGKVYKAQYDTEKQRDAETQGKIQKDVDSDGQTRLQKAFDAKWREQLQKAMEAYDSASDYLQLVRRDYGSISKKFGVESENFYLDRADLLIQAAKVATEDDGKQNLLKSAIDSIESRQEAGLRNYFQDECVTEKSLKGEERRLQDNEALVYLVMFGNRIESVLKFSDGNMQQETSECKCNNLSQQIETLRTGLANRYRAPRVDLGFSGLISKLIITKSFQEKLSNFRNKIDTLLIVPSGELLRIPFAALLVGDPGKEPYPNEKEPYLVQHYAIAVLPSWKLSSISPSAIDLKQDSALLAGLIIEPPLSKMEIEQPKEKIDEPKVCQQRSNAVETNRDDSRSVCAKPLCYVGKEITEIEGIIQNQNRTTLLGANFTVGKVEGILKNKDYSVIHFSTHGYFDKNSQNSWLCTYNKGETLTLDRLEELLQGKQAKLLTLSACETALGAELGLAGIGVKVGTQSALGSLWSVDDESTALLMQKFYENLQEKNLKNNGYSIAKALQRAQLDLLGDEEAKSTTADNFKIPFYWAGYLLIGNWQNK